MSDERIKKWYDSDNIIRYFLYVALSLGAGNGYYLTQIEKQTDDRYRAADAKRDFERRDDRISWLTSETMDHRVRIRSLEAKVSTLEEEQAHHSDFEARIRILEKE